MKIKSRSIQPVDPSNFSSTINCGNAPYDINFHQDTAEVLQFVINERKGSSVAASDLISNIIRSNISCNQCFCFSILLSPDINPSLSKFLKPQMLGSDNKWF